MSYTFKKQHKTYTYSLLLIFYCNFDLFLDENLKKKYNTFQ